MPFSPSFLPQLRSRGLNDLVCLLVAMKLVIMGSILLGWHSRVGHLAHPVAAGREDGFSMAPYWETRLLTTPQLLDCSHQNYSFDSLDSGDSVVILHEGGHGNWSGQVLYFVAIDGEDDLLLN